jgi:Protein of unknown function (DUF3309)
MSSLNIWLTWPPWSIFRWPCCLRRLAVEALILILVVLLFFGAVGAAPRWSYSSQWGWGPSGFTLILVLILLAFLLFTPGKAHAGDGISPLAWQCAKLYKARNDFYSQGGTGLCFTRKTAKELYPENDPKNGLCQIKSSEDFPITARQKRLIDAIVAKERALGCPRL